MVNWTKELIQVVHRQERGTGAGSVIFVVALLSVASFIFFSTQEWIFNVKEARVARAAAQNQKRYEIGRVRGPGGYTVLYTCDTECEVIDSWHHIRVIP